MPAQIIPIEPHTDGDASHLPKSEWQLVNPPTIYLEKIAALWMTSRGEAKPGINYYLQQLPAGYRLYERPRPGNAKHVDKHLYGHPNHKIFDSPNRFFPHFEHLMSHGSNKGCPCTVCAAKVTGTSQRNGTSQGADTSPVPSSSTIKKPGRKPFALATAQAKPLKAPVDEESTPDTLRHLINKLKVYKEIDREVQEKLSMDWRAERPMLSDTLQNLAKQKSWLPRAGEIVLFVRDPEGEICLEAVTQEFKLFNTETNEFGTHPLWEAGVVGQVADETIKLQDIVEETVKTQSIANSGYRIEPLPDPNSKDKSLTRQYKYVPLHQIRPFVFWMDILKGVAEEKRHPTIKNALTVMASVSLIDRLRFKGKWPLATMTCRGIYIGSELLCVGDAVRLLPGPGNDKVSDVLQIESIKLKLSNLDKASNDDDDEGHPYNSAVHICGRAYTLDETRAFNLTPVSRAQPGMQGYEDWYCMHDPSKQYQVSFTRILGRCFEAEPMMLWFPSTTLPDDTRAVLNHGLEGVLLARKKSLELDSRIQEGKTWYWGDSRAETLAIESLNGVDVSYYDKERDKDKLEEWRKAARVLEKTATPEERTALSKMVLAERLTGATMGAGTRMEALRAAAAASDPTDSDMMNIEDSRDSTPTVASSRRGAMEADLQPEASNARKRSFSEAESRDELDQDGEGYDLDQWVKPVVMLGTPSQLQTAKRSKQREPSQSISPDAEATLAALADFTSRKAFNGKNTDQQLETSSSESPDPVVALAAFQRPRVVVTIDD